MRCSKNGHWLWPRLLLLACCTLQACVAANASSLGVRHRREVSEESLLHGGSGHHETTASSPDAAALGAVIAAGTAIAAGSSNASECPSGAPAHLDQQKLREFDCLVLENVCIDQTRFIVDQDELRPGRTFWSDDLFDINQHDINEVSGEGPFYNMPGVPDNWKGAKKKFRKPFFRIQGTRDPADVKAAKYDECSMPLVWWPAWPFSGDYYLSSLAPLELMQRQGLFDKNVRFTPVFDGLTPAPQVRWLLEPFTNHKVQTLEELSDRSNAGNRCFKRVMLCKLYSLWHKRPVLDWTTGLQFGTIGQQAADDHDLQHLHLQIVEHLRPQLTEIPREPGVFRIGWIERKKKRLIRDHDSLVAQCNTWQPPDGSGYTRTECMTINFDDSSQYLEQISIAQSLDVMVAMHGSGLINHNFMRPNTSFVEVVPCHFDSTWQEFSFQKPARQENIQFAFEIKVTNEAYCWPSAQTRDDKKPDLSDEDWVWGSFVRDQDVTLNVTLLQETLGKIVALKGDGDLYQQLDQSNADFAFVKQE